nr:MAG TPA: hypothetical protein [Caudoviricetes sp.]
MLFVHSFNKKSSPFWTAFFIALKCRMCEIFRTFRFSRFFYVSFCKSSMFRFAGFNLQGQRQCGGKIRLGFIQRTNGYIRISTVKALPERLQIFHADYRGIGKGIER